jgi:hypothetical protein
MSVPQAIFTNADLLRNVNMSRLKESICEITAKASTMG